jgi:hypothetical protein
MKPQDTKGFRQLNIEWQRKLKDSGFKDLENKDRDRPLINPIYKLKKIKDYEAVREHFLNATHYLIEGKFENQLERNIWRLYSEGLSIRQIVPQVKKAKTTVYYYIDKVRRRMKKFYSEKCKRHLKLL